MGLGVGLIVLSAMCLLAGFIVGASLWFNLFGPVAGLAGQVLLGQKKAENGK